MQMDKITPILSVRNVSNLYISRIFGPFGKKIIKPVLNNVNLELKTGEILGLTGNSGCGKTTLARCILGITNYTGEILIAGQKIKNSPQTAQLIFQDTGNSLNPAKKIGWLMEEPLIINKTADRKERNNKVDEMLFNVGLNHLYKKRKVNELSGGQKQRVCIGRALILKPRLLIADEIVSSLDVSTGAQILNLLRELHKNLGLSILFISHNKDAVEYLCSRTVVMKDGSILEGS